MLRLPRLAVVLTAGLLFAAACGGGGSTKPAAQVDADGESTSSSSQSSESSSSDGGAGGGALPGDIVQSQYSQGTGHIELSGGKSGSADFNTAGGVTTQGHTLVTFTDGGSNALILTVSKTENETGIVITLDGLSTGGQFGDKCTLDVKKNDASELAGTFTCNDVDGVNGGQVFEHINVKGSFSAKP
jgi:hypothetical protein